MNKCGYFDNGFDKEHEHRVNCRACLLLRIAQLTSEVANLLTKLAHHEAEKHFAWQE